MTRKSPVDTCFICGETPCGCGKKPAKVRVYKPAVETQPLVVELIRRVRAPYSLSDEELLENDAIRNLAPLLSEESRSSYAILIAGKPTQAEQRATWRARRRASQNIEDE